jgi:hypothetical protein
MNATSLNGSAGRADARVAVVTHRQTMAAPHAGRVGAAYAEEIIPAVTVIVRLLCMTALFHNSYYVFER